MSEKNMTLLSQKEIDTLIEFLSGEDWRKGASNDVLNQESVDRLIALIRSSHGRRRLGGLRMVVERSEELKKFYAERDEAYSDKTVYELVVGIKEDGQMELLACNKTSGKQISIFPEHLLDLSFEGASDGWGRCLMPRVFYQAADTLGLEYTEETEAAVKNQFAAVMYGDEKARIPELYL
ncbi:MAG: hypothetical protein HFI40_05835 [Lachnospiraceae bacterium]|jgi:hypothetical protein|nr:hypothetical protein [Lachnospiraceae bacterium]MCX4317582.1 hypothetical protein [Lachnospiraceae bacterium]